MTKEKMTIHEALSEVKTLESRILKLLANSTFVRTAKVKSSQVDGVLKTEMSKNMKSEYQKVQDLINRYNAIRRAVTLSNAVTEVEINGQKYTVTEAIAMKQTGIIYKESLLDRLAEQYRKAQKDIKDNNAKAEADANEQIVKVFGNKETAKAEDIEKVRNNTLEMQALELIDPINVAKEIAKLEEEISVFKTKIDSVLSISNAVTSIEIEY